MKMKLPERRRFVRIEIPLEVVAMRGERNDHLVTKNISPVGFMVEAKDKFDEGVLLPFIIRISPSDPVNIAIKGKVIWQRKVSLEDGAPYAVGLDIAEIEDSSKNDFLKYLCDLLYRSEYKERPDR